MKKLIALILSLLLCFSAVACGGTQPAGDDVSSTVSDTNDASSGQTATGELDINNLPEYVDTPFVSLGKTTFTSAEKTTESFETYAELDSLGRCGVTFASVGKDIMPTEDRGAIGQVKPTGWHTVKYDCVDGKYLYNRCHLIGFQLTGENANEKNLITGTRYMNVDGMLPFENMVADYVKETGNHVMYRVTPIYVGNELLCRGVQMEAYSVEDDGDGIDFNVYVFNVQPGVEIDYKTGESRLSDSTPAVSSEPENSDATVTFALNTNTKKYHRVDCDSVKDMNPNNKKIYTGPLSGLEGYSPCGNCKPLEALK
ncbi:MAG: DNA/RNA non-specific endonuclease [Clostridia bacterium]|nr:DNA/RNA non-specific endonuclease [Clostridia bacterium]